MKIRPVEVSKARPNIRMNGIALPNISIVTPSFNQGRFLQDTIRSVLDQRYPNIEYIVIDGGSTDNSVDVIKTYADKLTYWVSEKDNGQTDAINKGFRMATGEIIAWINSDDMYCENALMRVGQYFKSHHDCFWVCGNLLFTNADGTVFARKRPLYSPFVIRHASASVFQPNVFVRKQVLDEVGLPRADFHAVMDREWFCRIAERYPPHIIDCDIALFRWHAASKSSSDRQTLHYRQYVKESAEISARYLPKLAVLIKKFPRFSISVLIQLARVRKLIERVLKYIGLRQSIYKDA